MQNTQGFLNGLDNLTFTKMVDKTLYTIEGFEVSHSIEMLSTKHLPLQIVLRIRKDNVYVTSWGCSSNEDNALVSFWWLKKYGKLNDIEYTNKSEKQEHFKNQFNQLIKL